jgi:MFS family permease
MSGPTDGEAPPVSPGLSSREMNKGMRRFMLIGAISAARVSVIGVGSAIITGYALYLGMSESMIGLLIPFAVLASLVQLISLHVTSRFRNQKAMFVTVGVIETLLRLCIIFIPLLFVQSLRGWALLFMFLFVNMFTFGVNPILNSWFGSIIPSTIRGRYIGKRSAILAIVGLPAGLYVGQFIDNIKNGWYGFSAFTQYHGFAVLFILGAVLGLARMQALWRTPFPAHLEHKATSPRGLVKALWAHPQFLSMNLLHGGFNFAFYMSAAYYSVIMLKHLNLSYTTIALLVNLQVLLITAGYRFWGKIIDRYGAKTVLQTIMLPLLLIPFLWTLNKEGFYPFLIAAMALGGITLSGFSISIVSLMYQLLPDNKDRAPLLVTYSIMANGGAVLGPVVGAGIIALLGDFQTNIFGFPFKSIQFVFLVSMAAMLLPFFLLRRLKDTAAVGPRVFLGQFLHGNIFSFLYGSFQFSRSTHAESRVKAAGRMGRSQSPMAVQVLSDALQDPDINVRRAVTHALGETGQDNAVPVLAGELNDKESHVRHEAAEALGRIKSQAGLKHLLRALDDDNPQVRASATTALADIGGPEACDALLKKFSGPFDRTLFPLLIQSLGKMGEFSIVPQAITMIDDYSSIVIKRQLLHSVVCPLFKGNGDFYRALFMDRWESVGHIEKILISIRKKLVGLDKRNGNSFKNLINSHDELTASFVKDEFGIGQKAILDHCKSLALAISRNSSDDPSALKALESVAVFHRCQSSDQVQIAGFIFTILCIRFVVNKLDYSILK